MPNHCSNATIITGPAEDIKRFAAAIINSDGEAKLAESLLPTPAELRDTNATNATELPHSNWANLLAAGEITQEWYDHLCESNAKAWAEQQANRAAYGFAHWYDWAISTWGTKWGDYDTDYTLADDSFTLIYTTAWSPFNTQFWLTVSSLWPTLTFVTEFAEEGLGFIGAFAAHNGEVVEVEGTFPHSEDEDPDYQAWWADVLIERGVCSKRAADALQEALLSS